jgi:hypothetical protein
MADPPDLATQNLDCSAHVIAMHSLGQLMDRLDTLSEQVKQSEDYS